jgi:alpha-galactosidase
MRKSALRADVSSWIRYGEQPQRGGLFFGGGVIRDERFIEGRLHTAYWSSHGQVWPDRYMGNTGKGHPVDSFCLAINGQDLSGGYRWENAVVTPDESGCRTDGMAATHGVVSLFHEQAGIRVKVHTRVDRSRFTTRWLEVENVNDRHVAITDVAPMSGFLWSHPTSEHLPPDRPSPFEVAYTHRSDALKEGDVFFDAVPHGVLKVDGGRCGKSGWGRPAFWARNLCNGQTFVCEFAWSGNWEFTLDCRLTEEGHGNRIGALFFRMGMVGYDPALRVLDPGETVTTPPVHLALFEHDTDAIVQQTHDYVRHAIMPAQIPGRHIEIEANHRGYLCDAENVPGIIKDIDVAKSIGAEMYVIDAGWYGKEPNVWWDNTGDWVAGPWLDGGLEPIVSHVKKRGMKFGLWIEIEAAGNNTDLKKNHPDWLFSRDGKPVNGRCLDFSNTVVVDWAEREIVRMIKRYRMDMYRLDNNHTLNPSGNREYGGFKEDLIWRYYENFYGMWERLVVKFPKVVFQNCSSGGGRLDWGVMRRFHNTEPTDFMRNPRNGRIFNGLTMSLPPETMLRTFGTEVWDHVLDGDLDMQIRSVCIARPIFRGIAPMMEQVTPELRERVEHCLDLYRKVIRPLMPDCRVYHHTPFQPLFEHRTFNVIEYAARDRKTALVAVFRMSATGGDEYVLYPRGLDIGTDYAVTLDNRSQTKRVSGWQLMQEGIRICLERTMSSELVVFKALGGGSKSRR